MTHRDRFLQPLSERDAIDRGRKVIVMGKIFNFRLDALSNGDIGVSANEATRFHRDTADLDYPPVGPAYLQNARPIDNEPLAAEVLKASVLPSCLIDLPLIFQDMRK